jgi:hypothetical protein
LSPRNANYQLEARLDHATRTLAGTGIVRWRNIGLAPTNELRLHLYWNAWRNADSSWLRERALAGWTADDVRHGDWAAIDLQQLTLQHPDGRAGFCFRLYLMLYECVASFDVTKNLKFFGFWGELNKA